MNLSDLPADELARTLECLEHDRATSGHKRVFAPPYMQLRKLTEEKLRELFVAAGGRPGRENPHYFVLGRSRWFESLYPESRSVVLPLSQLATEIVSFTYPDSMAAMAIAREWGFPPESRPYHEKVFRLEELEAVVAEHGLPDDDPETMEGERYLEVQVWSDDPVRHLFRPR